MEVPQDFEQNLKLVLQENKIAFADKKEETAFMRRAAEKAGRGESYYIPIGLTFVTVPKLLFANFNVKD